MTDQDRPGGAEQDAGAGQGSGAQQDAARPGKEADVRKHEAVAGESPAREPETAGAIPAETTPAEVTPADTTPADTIPADTIPAGDDQVAAALGASIAAAARKSGLGELADGETPTGAALLAALGGVRGPHRRGLRHRHLGAPA